MGNTLPSTPRQQPSLEASAVPPEDPDAHAVRQPNIHLSSDPSWAVRRKPSREPAVGFPPMTAYGRALRADDSLWATK